MHKMLLLLNYFNVHTSVDQHVSNGEHEPSPVQKLPSAEHSDSEEETEEIEEAEGMEEAEEMEEEEGMEEQDNASLPAMTFMKRKISTASVTSMYSASCGKGDYEISGKVLLGVWHKEEQLFVRVTRAKKIAAAKENGFSDPYIETNLLPDKSKQTKRKTTVQKKTLDPVYDEILKVGVCCEPLTLQLVHEMDKIVLNRLCIGYGSFPGPGSAFCHFQYCTGSKRALGGGLGTRLV